MIVVKLDGGLGNQLFQYAAGKALATRHNAELFFDITALEKCSRGVTPRSFELGFFSYVGKFINPDEFSYFSFSKYFPIIFRRLNGLSVYVEVGVGFSESFSSLPDNTFLAGYWQSPRYFADISAQLIFDLVPINALSQKSLAIAEEINLNNSVAIHVRRGDYVSLASAASFHGAMPLSYYMAAIARVRESVVDPMFFVFSDDQDWCRNNLKLGNSTTFVDHNFGDDSWQDLVLMGHCRHNVIANSSFSWWGAWIADQRWAPQQRVVIAPARWFSGKADINLNDRFPAHWEVLS